MPRATDYVLAPTERGAIDNLRLTETDVPPPAEGYVQVRVEAAGLNFRDVLNVLGLYPGDPGPIGGDFAGIVTQLGSGVTGLEVGQRVYGFMQGAFASRFNVPAQLLAPIPDGVSAVAAATIPAAALTARLAFDWAQLKPGDRVLIHAASGGVGLAAIQMAQQHGAIVFATASTYKRATLRKMGVKYVYDSRTTDFADQILARHRRRRRRRGAQQPDQRGVPRSDRAGHRPERPFRRDRQARHLDAGADGGGPSRHRLRDRRAGHGHLPRARAHSCAC